ncbi:hypothetical protein CXB51_014745 [Gossypium anomalum]|uniref:DRBM domain-containing protein n=1 Tax=Gossypium anomalum TaxID=47600 RepID=A0A8J5ZKY9_9ROSI|nr:hypothetical protein CXB51_014745 [Gossypium anomalum]
MVNSLMHMYINFGDLSATLMLYDTISAKEDIACWNTIIFGCTNNGHFREALATFNWMRQEGKSLHGLAIKTFVGSETDVYKNLLQETAHRVRLNLLVYTTIRCGPGHNRTFSCMVEPCFFHENKHLKANIN